LGGRRLRSAAKAALSSQSFPCSRIAPSHTADDGACRGDQEETRTAGPVQDAPPWFANLPTCQTACEAPEDVLISLTKERETGPFATGLELEKPAGLNLPWPAANGLTSKKASVNGKLKDFYLRACLGRR